MAERRVITEPTFASRIGLSLPTVRRMRKRGELEYIELSENRIGYREDYPDELIKARTVQPKAVRS